MPLEDLRLLEMVEDLIDVEDAKIAIKEYEAGNVTSLAEVEQLLIDKRVNV